MRAINGGPSFPGDSLMKNCLALAVLKSYSVFALENGNECFTAADAELTYQTHGAATNCKDGVGGSWSLDVYRIVPCKPGNVWESW